MRRRTRSKKKTTTMTTRSKRPHVGRPTAAGDYVGGRGIAGSYQSEQNSAAGNGMSRVW